MMNPVMADDDPPAVPSVTDILTIDLSVVYAVVKPPIEFRAATGASTAVGATVLFPVKAVKGIFFVRRDII
jgi:hypothetical protein